ncbi:DUF4225 domain-containing protein [Pantoea allii]|uniref:DUF4225 domain-containing protein n=1 Tax=Pantoea allii TaxID=574096 RepID=UPI003D322B50
MDTALLSMMRSGGRNQAWAETMVNLEARKLADTANVVAASHLKHGLSRIQFVQEIRDVIEAQFALARQAKTDEECMACVKNLRAENDSLQYQARMLRTQAAKLYAKVEFIRENNRIVGYAVSAVNLVLNGLTVYGGFVLLATMTPVAVVAGAIIMIDGFNSISKEIINHTSYGPSEGIIADASTEIASFMGFRPEYGLAAYNAVSLTANIYGLVGLTRKPESWRLFRWLRSDFRNKLESMSRPKLALKIVSYGVRGKVVVDLVETARSQDN